MNKSDKSKSSLLIIFIAVFAVILTFILGKNILNIKYIVREDGYYKYLVLTSHNEIFEKKDNPVAIVGFTEEGKKQENIYIPREIKGHRVTHLGYYFYNHFDEYQYPLWVGGNIKKVFIYDNIINYEYFYGQNCEYYDCSYTNYNIKMSVNNRVKMTRGAGYLDYSLVYGFKHYYKFNEEYQSSQNWNDNVSVGNVEFMNNYPNELKDNYYSLDNIKGDEKLYMPPNPILEGYDFTGWYTEPECVNKFNFSISPTIEENKIFRLYAGWTIR